MKMKILMSVSLTACFTSTAFASTETHWSYTGHEGPEYWGSLKPAYSVCASGKNQSPINLTGFIEADLTPIEFNYLAGGHEVVNNGHTIQVNFKAGSSISLNGHEYDLKQFHFHAPSENLIEGKSYPMEAHLVHADKQGKLAVVALMIEQGSENKELKEAWRKMPNTISASALNTLINAASIVPGNQAYYRFNGSLTTPPCSEGVTWLVMKQAIMVSKEQIDKFSHVVHHPNNRPVQAINARTVLK